MKKLIPVLIIAVLVIGLSVLLYPTAANYFNARSQSRVVARYYESLEGLDDAEYGALLDAAHEYNRKLNGRSNRYSFTEEDDAEYRRQLSVNNSGVMGIIEIERINVRLPVYHGTSESVLQAGTGHLEGTSLPVGGANTHSAVTGHRGLPSSLLFTHLDKLAVGDTFILYVLKETLTYKIDQILVVEPDQTEAMEPAEGMDYCTLMTCTPYGINSHRMLLRGHRIENAAADEEARLAEIAAKAREINVLWFIVPAAVVLIGAAIFVVTRKKR